MHVSGGSSHLKRGFHVEHLIHGRPLYAGMLILTIASWITLKIESFNSEGRY